MHCDAQVTWCWLGAAGCDGLRALPDSMGQFPNLRELDLTGCARLQRLPDSIGALHQLTNLQMPRCTSIRTLPQRLCSLAHLATFNAGALLPAD